MTSRPCCNPAYYGAAFASAPPYEEYYSGELHLHREVVDVATMTTYYEYDRYKVLARTYVAGLSIKPRLCIPGLYPDGVRPSFRANTEI